MKILVTILCLIIVCLAMKSEFTFFYKAHPDQVRSVGANKINKDKHEKIKPCKDKKMTKETNSK